MKNSRLLVCLSRVLFPFIMVFGFYIILNGHLSPGGGFQGGAILATAVLITYFIEPENMRVFENLIRYEKWLFVGIVFTAFLSFITKGIFFTNPFPIDAGILTKSLFIVFLNILIGVKVSMGLVSILASFIEDGGDSL
ncbi:MAG TPA: MnhB domain-containing protein [Clostridia bacterium]|nr:MnhB domain-containing protein [Clostridia bacterium]